MLTNRIRATLVVLAASAGLAGCTSLGPYGGIGVGVGSGYGGYGGYGYDPYDPYYSGYGYGSRYGYSPFGWHNGFYYPGAGYWVYDPYGGRHPINRDQSAYWRNVIEKFRAARGAQASAEVKENFSGFRSRAKSGATIQGVDLDAHARAQAQADRGSVRQLGDARRQVQVERQQQMRAAREQARSERAQARSESQSAVREAIIERREQRRVRRGDE